MAIEHAYRETQSVWPVEHEGRLTLLTTRESAEEYAAEHDGTILDPMPVLSARTVWHRVTLEIADGEQGASYSVMESAEPEVLKPIVTKGASVRCMGYSPEIRLEVTAESEERAHEIAERLGTDLVGWHEGHKPCERAPRSLKAFIRKRGYRI